MTTIERVAAPMPLSVLGYGFKTWQNDVYKQYSANNEHLGKRRKVVGLSGRFPIECLGIHRPRNNPGIQKVISPSSKTRELPQFRHSVTKSEGGSAEEKVPPHKDIPPSSGKGDAKSGGDWHKRVYGGEPAPWQR